jgi:membrane fusion protein (multidrug efflux system)
MKRYSELVKDHSITQQQYEQALAAYQSAQKQLQVLVDQEKPGECSDWRGDLTI